MNKPGRKRTPAQGFALLVTLMLMILLAILALGLLSLSSVSLRNSGRELAMAEARANARMALMLALGELQKAAGPDQRVTATADMAAAAGGNAVATGEDPKNGISLDGTEKGLSRVHPGTRHWTGVFVNRDAPDSIYKKTPAPRIEQWLVSGAASMASGQPPTLTPANGDCLVNADGTAASPDKAAVLVGINTVGKGTASQDQYVAAPFVSIEPGGNSGLAGKFAYWIGDEGVKARLNMERTAEDPASYASLVAQRRGWETVPGFSGYPSASGNADRQLPSLVTLRTVECMLPATQQGNPSPGQSVFHSATTDSRGLLVDTLSGGIRVDLTSAFSGGLLSAKPADGYDNYPAKGTRVIPTAAVPGLQHLKWDHLLDFYNRHGGLSSGSLKVRSRTAPDTEAIAPLVFDFRILMGVRVESSDKSIPDNPNYNINPCGKFAVSIANPYSVPLEWDNDLEFEIKNQTPGNNSPSRVWDAAVRATCVFIPGGGGLDSPSTEPAVFNQAVFRIRPGRLEPGEARAYTQGSKVTRQRSAAAQRVVVDMAAFGGAAPFDFNNSVEMVTGSRITLPRGLDIRESWQTTLVALEMRLGGSGSGHWLRRIEGFELDNGYFVPNTRNFTKDNVKDLRGPVPVMLYSFQISQPGMDYLALMPAGYQLGQRASTLRTFTDFNLRATNIPNPIASYNPPPYFVESNESQALLPFEPGGQTGIGFTRNLAINPLHWGHTSESGSKRTVLFSVPRQFISLAQFQHADLTCDDTALSIGHQPGNAFANSYATPFVKRGVISQVRTDYVIVGVSNRTGTINTPRNYYDISHLLNSSLWDRYFYSTIASGSTVPGNTTLVVAPGAAEGDLRDPARAAGGLIIEGAFNINSTDAKAWKAFLASSKHFRHSADKSASTEAAFPRSLDQPSEHALPPSGEENDSLSGYRRLTDTELEALSAEIVKQVRLRGPFVSLSHFANRALAGINENKELTRSGALQLSLDESGVNISHDGSRSGFNGISASEDRVTLREKQGAPRADLDGGKTANLLTNADPSHPDWARTSQDLNYGAVASIVADQEMLAGSSSANATGLALEQGFRSTGIPAWVTQADVLQVIGTSISARSDTFRIRSRGDARDAAGKLLATAYCEAIVQRQPGFIDPANRPHDRTSQLTQTNKTYGRRFEIVSFRWLSPDEI